MVKWINCREIFAFRLKKDYFLIIQICLILLLLIYIFSIYSEVSLSCRLLDLYFSFFQKIRITLYYLILIKMIEKL